MWLRREGATVGGLISPNPKAAVVPFPDGTHRLLYCMESPEVWFEDFGAAKLTQGRVVVKLDPNFGRVIKRGDYRVFVTPEADCRGPMSIASAPAASTCASLPGGRGQVERFPIALLPGARTSGGTHALRRSTRALPRSTSLSRYPLRRRARHPRAHGAGERRPRGSCAHCSARRDRRHSNERPRSNDAGPERVRGRRDDAALNSAASVFYLAQRVCPGDHEHRDARQSREK